MTVATGNAIQSADQPGGGGGSGTVTSIAATDTSIVVSGNPTVNPTIATGTLDVIAADHPPAANWSNNSHKITSLANGSAAQDAAAFGQTPAGGATVTIAEGGTGQTAAAAAYNALSPMTTKGDIEYDSAGGTAARLAIGTAAGATGDFLGVSSGVPAWQQVSGQYLCTPAQYAPASRTVLTTTSTTMAAVSSGNAATGSFTAPASGSVLVTAYLVILSNTSGNTIAFALAASGTVTPLVSNVDVVEANFQIGGAIPFLVSSLTPGTSYNFDLLWSSPSGTTDTVVAWGQVTTTPAASTGGPIIMTVQAV